MYTKDADSCIIPTFLSIKEASLICELTPLTFECAWQNASRKMKPCGILYHNHDSFFLLLLSSWSLTTLVSLLLPTQYLLSLSWSPPLSLPLSPLPPLLSLHSFSHPPIGSSLLLSMFSSCCLLPHLLPPLLISSPSSPFTPILPPPQTLTLQTMVRCWWWSRQQWGAAPYWWSSPSSCSSQDGELHVLLGLCLLSWSFLSLSVVLGVWSMSLWVSASSHGLFYVFLEVWSMSLWAFASFSGLFYICLWFWGSGLCLSGSLFPLVV